MRKYLALLLATGAAGALLFGTIGHAARGKRAGTPTVVSAFGCIVVNGGQVTRPAGSEIVIRQGFAEYSRGVLESFLTGQATLASVNDGQMFDVSNAWGEPVYDPVAGWWISYVYVPTGVTLANVGDSMRFTFSLYVTAKVPEVLPGVGPTGFNGPGLAFGGTCTVTAT